MANYRKGIHDLGNSIIVTALATVILFPAGGPAFASSGWFDEIFRKDTASFNENAKAGRTEAVDRAFKAFEKAQAAGAERIAPYEYYSAEEYLNLAKEELNSGDKIGVAFFAAESERYSLEAIEKADGGSR
jgi:hypothetical protein